MVFCMAWLHEKISNAIEGLNILVTTSNWVWCSSVWISWVDVAIGPVRINITGSIYLTSVITRVTAPVFQ